RRAPGVHVDQDRAKDRVLVLEMTEEGVVEGAERGPEPSERAGNSPCQLAQGRVDLLDEVTEDGVLVEDEAADLTRAQFHGCSPLVDAKILRSIRIVRPLDARHARGSQRIRPGIPGACENRASISSASERLPEEAEHLGFPLSGREVEAVVAIP